MSRTESWQVRKVAASLGAEVVNADLSEISTDEADRIKELLSKHKVLFFPGQSITVDQHVELGSHFGVIESHPNLKNPYTEHDKVFELAASKGGIADEWHTDLTFMEEPSIMSVLHMVTCPEVGGDTMGDGGKGARCSSRRGPSAASVGAPMNDSGVGWRGSRPVRRRLKNWAGKRAQALQSRLSSPTTTPNEMRRQRGPKRTK